MPTGYTAFIEDGKITTAKDFIMLCTRNFGATVEMRGKPLDTPIPEEFTGSTFYAEHLEAERKRLAELRAMTHDEAQKKADAEYQENIKYRAEAKQKAEALLGRYTAMQEEIRRWKPPTPEHEGLKEFAIEQIEISKPYMEWYSPEHDPKKLTGEEWLEAQIENCMDSIRRSKEMAQKEADCTASRNKWVKELRESLKNM